MRGTRYRQQFGESLHNGKKKDLENWHVVSLTGFRVEFW
jgi:hypothetical protein